MSMAQLRSRNTMIFFTFAQSVPCWIIFERHSTVEWRFSF